MGALLAVRFAPGRAGEAGIVIKHQAEGLVFTIGALLSGLLIVVLWRYFHVVEVPIKEPSPRPHPHWIDFLHDGRPGPMNRRREGILPEWVVQRRTQNRGSLLADHRRLLAEPATTVRSRRSRSPSRPSTRAGPPAGRPETPARRRCSSCWNDAYKRRHGRVSALPAPGLADGGGDVRRPRAAHVAAGRASSRPSANDPGRRPARRATGLHHGHLLPSIVMPPILPIEGIGSSPASARRSSPLISGSALWVGSRFWTRVEHGGDRRGAPRLATRTAEATAYPCKPRRRAWPSTLGPSCMWSSCR